MARSDWDDDPTPITDITDPKRSALEAENAIARVTVRELRAERIILLGRIRDLEAEVRRLEQSNRLLRRK